MVKFKTAWKTHNDKHIPMADRNTPTHINFEEESKSERYIYVT